MNRKDAESAENSAHQTALGRQRQDCSQHRPTPPHACSQQMRASTARLPASRSSLRSLRLCGYDAVGMTSSDSTAAATKAQEPDPAHAPADAAAGRAQPRGAGLDGCGSAGPVRAADLPRLRRGAVPATGSVPRLPVGPAGVEAAGRRRRTARDHGPASQQRSVLPRAAALAAGHGAAGRGPHRRGAPACRRFIRTRCACESMPAWTSPARRCSLPFPDRRLRAWPTIGSCAK